MGMSSGNRQCPLLPSIVICLLSAEVPILPDLMLKSMIRFLEDKRKSAND